MCKLLRCIVAVYASSDWAWLARKVLRKDREGTGCVKCLQVGVYMPSDPVLAAWKGASEFATSPDYSQQAITKAHYEEMGYERLLNLAPDAAKAAATGYYTTSG